MVELADTEDLKSSTRERIRVRVPVGPPYSWFAKKKPKGICPCCKSRKQGNITIHKQNCLRHLEKLWRAQ